MNKMIRVVRIGYKVIVGVSTGYFVHQLTDEKATKLLDDGGMINAAMIGLGQGALASMAGMAAYFTIG